MFYFRQEEELQNHIKKLNNKEKWLQERYKDWRKAYIRICTILVREGCYLNSLTQSVIAYEVEGLGEKG